MSTEPGARPIWKHGDWFEFEVKFDNTFVALETREKLVVAKAGPDGYELGAGNRDLGVIDSHFDDFFVGKLDGDLNAVLSADGTPTPFKMFQWPISAGSSWSTLLHTDPFGQGGPDSVLLTATKNEKVKDPRGESPGFDVAGVTEGGYQISYTYSSRVQWITHFQKQDPTGRTVLELSLRDSGKNFTGSFHIVTKETLLERLFITPFFVFDPTMGPAPPDLLSVTKDFTFLEEILAVIILDVPPQNGAPGATGAGAFNIGITYPDNTPRYLYHAAAGTSFKFEVTDLEPYQKGTYTVTIEGTGVGGAFVAYYGFLDQVVEFNPRSHENH